MVESRPNSKKNSAHLEKQEALKTQHYMFLAGLLSAGGEINLRARNHLHAARPKEGKSYGISQEFIPEIFFYGSEAQVKKLNAQYGGYTYFHNQHETPVWKVQGHEAIELAKEVKSFVPSRTAELEVFLGWENSSKSKRAEMKRKLEELKRSRIIESTEQQTSLLTNPVFLAGIFEASASIPQTQDGPVAENPLVSFRSRNVGALQEIGNMYGHNSQPVDVKGRELLLAGQDAVRILEIVKPHLSGQVSDYVKAA